MLTNHIFSIYIPVVSCELNELTISIELGGYGIIDRIDFIPAKKNNKNNMSAFVYFTFLVQNEITKRNLKEEIFYRESNRLTSYKHFLQKYGNPTDYWIILRNKKPIENTILNIHQIVAQLQNLENIIAEQKDRIDQLQTWKYVEE
jgi:hypothetical protein